MDKTTSVVGIVLLIVGLGIGYWYGNTQGDKAGYARALADTKATQEAIAKKAGDDAAKAANPFQTTNPLQGVSTNPFEAAAKKLNPFAQ